MRKFDEYPKVFKKIIRYIKHDSISIEQLESMQKILNHQINKRKKKISYINMKELN